jgi:hypothetical protein
MNSAESAEPIRLLVSDIDGTLVRDDKTLPSANLDAIVALQAAGVATTLTSSPTRRRSALLVVRDAVHTQNGNEYLRNRPQRNCPNVGTEMRDEGSPGDPLSVESPRKCGLSTGI